MVNRTTTAHSKTKRTIAGYALFVSMIAAVMASFHAGNPPDVIPANAPDSVFSAERAALHLEHIASVKNPIGSEENTKVREYILETLEELGMHPHVHRTEYYDPATQRAAVLHNVLARVRGTGNGGAILFMGHYDTVADAYGAADNGSAVAAMLELLRMLRHYPPLTNDLIFFFPDGEEVGLLGAKAFLDEHEWAADIDLVVNLEARGTSGQSIMFETSYNNLRLIREFAATVPKPFASSLSYEIYSRLPTDTDFTPFKHKGFHGFNIAFIDNAHDYHTAGDNPDNLDLRSLQHHGSYSAAIALGMGNSMPDLSGDENAVYFNTWGYHFVHYPYSLVTPLSIAILIVFLFVVALGIRGKQIKPLKLPGGLIVFAAHLAMVYAIVDSLYRIVASHYQGTDQLLLAYNSTYLMIALTAVAVGFSMFFFYRLMRGFAWKHAAGLFVLLLVLLIWSGQFTWWVLAALAAATILPAVLFRKPASVWDLSMGALLAMVIVLLIAGTSVAGGSYLIAWPLLSMLLMTGVFFLWQSLNTKPAGKAIVLFLFSLPVLAWYPAIAFLFATAMGIQAAATATVITGAMMGMLIPQLHFIAGNTSRLIPSIVLLAGGILLLYIFTHAGYDERHRQPVNIVYAYSADTNESWWISADDRVNKWTSQFIGSAPDTLRLTSFFPHDEKAYLGKQCTRYSLEAPVAKLVGDTILSGQRMLTLKVRSVRDAAWLSAYLYTDCDTPRVCFTDNAPGEFLHPFKNSRWHPLWFFAPPEDGFSLTVFVTPGAQITLRLTDHRFGLPGFARHTGMPEYMMPQDVKSLATRKYSY